VKAPASGINAQLAVSLGAVTLLTVAVNAVVLWLLLKIVDEERRSEEVMATAELAAAALSAEAGTANGAAVRSEASVESCVDQGLDQGLDQGVDAGGALGRDVARLREALAASGLVLRVNASAAPPVDGPDLRLTGSLWGDRRVLARVPLRPGPPPAGLVELEGPLRAPTLPGGPGSFVLAYTSLSSLFIAGVGFAYLRSRLLRPLERLRASTDRIAAGEFGSLLQVSGARELVELCGAFNTMSASLDAYRSRTAAQVDALRAANAELAAAQQALQRSARLAGVGRLAAGVAHELGNPLAAVMGYVELLVGGLGDPRVEADLLRAAQRELSRMNQIIVEMLNYARPSTLALEPVDLRAAALRAVETVAPLPEFRGLRIDVPASPGPAVVVVATPDKLHQVLLNLLFNSRDAQNGDGELRLEVFEEGGQAALVVEDRGPGFPEAVRARLGEPFFTTKGPGDGTGLGIATCLQIVEGFGGAMRFENRPGGGARVSLRLPLFGAAFGAADV